MTQRRLLTYLIIFVISKSVAQVNFVGNPSFENIISCTNPPLIYKVKYWNSLDSTQIICGGDFFNTCATTVPKSPITFQYPKSGNGFIRTTFYCTSPCGYTSSRTYPKNRLLSPLTPNAIYCVKMFVNLTNSSSRAIDGLGIYVGDASLDTIKYCGQPLTFLTPQIQNSLSNIISDTLNWIEISGTFTATGTEKYLLVGNFKNDANTNVIPVNGTPGSFAEYMIDDVSLINYNLSAFAGPDKNINLGDSAFIGRPPEVGLECTWTSGSFTVGAVGGLWVKPTTPGTYSYVVTQNICGNIKSDTVNVNVSPSLISEHTLFGQSIQLFPQPSNDIVKLTFRNYSEETISIEIQDTNGKTVYLKDEYLKNNFTIIRTDNLSDGIYYLKIKNSKDQFATKKLTVTH